MFRLGRPRRALIVPVLALLASMGVVQDAPAAGLTWSKPVAVSQAPFSQWGTIKGVSCPTTTLCVAVSDLGGVVRSTNPTAATPTWKRQNLERKSFCNAGVNAFCPAGFYAVSCPSTSLCVAVDSAGDAWVSTDPAAADPTWTSAPVGDGTPLPAVSCLSASLCVAVDMAGRALVTHNPTAAAPTWSSAFIDTNALSAVSCSATNLCVAVDRFGKGFITTNPTVAHPAWKTAAIAGIEVIQSVSCISTTMCVAVGYTNAGGLFHQWAAITTNPTAATPTWTTTEIEEGFGSTSWAVSCTSTSFCLAVDDHGRTLRTTNPTAATPAWTVKDDIDGLNGHDTVSCVGTSLCVTGEFATGRTAISTNPAAASPTWKVTQIDGYSPIVGISCPTVSFCAAVDEQGNALVSTNPAAAGATWKHTPIAGIGAPTAISCPSASFCVAIASGDAIVSTNPAAASPTWTTTHIDNIPLSGISCVSTSLCVAVDRSGFTVTSTDPAGAEPGWFTTAVASGYTGGVSCPSTSLCVAVDTGHAYVSHDPAADFPTWTSKELYGGGFSAPPMYAISCPSAGLCVGGNLLGELWTSANPGADPPAWTLPASLSSQTTGISCPDIDFCVGVGSLQGRAMVSTDPADPSPTWSSADLDTPYPLQGVSCASAALCLAVDRAGQISTGKWEGPLPVTPVASTPPHITGTTTDGEQLTAAHGTWTGDPTSYDRQWQRCNSAGSACVAIPGAVGETYQLTTDDIGHTVRVSEIAHGLGGTGSPSVSAATAVVKSSLGPPEAFVPPFISGTLTSGEMLSVSHGSWTNSATDYAEQWQRCDSAGAACAEIAGATGLTYLLTAGDVGHTLRVAEIATGPGGPGNPSTSEATAVVQAPPAPPVASAPPAITGTTTDGELLSVTHGTWTGDPTGYAEQWQRCNSAGSACVAISGATAETYQLTAGDVGHTLRVREIASNPLGAGSPSVSPATAVVKAAPEPPVASAPPHITGTATSGQLLTATRGTWTGSPTSYTDTWMRCTNTGTGCSPIASGETYRLTSSDVGHTLRVAETATGPGGTGAPATSAATAVVQAVPTGGGGGGTGGTGGGGTGGTGGGGAGGTGGGGGGGTPPVGNPAPAPKIARATTSGAVVRVTITCATACTVTLTITVTETLRRGKVIAVSTRKRKVMIGKATARLAAGQQRSVRVTLNKAGRKLLAGRKRFKARLTVGQHGGPVSRATLTFRRKQHI